MKNSEGRFAETSLGCVHPYPPVSFADTLNKESKWYVSLASRRTQRKLRLFLSTLRFRVVNRLSHASQTMRLLFGAFSFPTAP